MHLDGTNRLTLLFFATMWPTGRGARAQSLGARFEPAAYGSAWDRTQTCRRMLRSTGSPTTGPPRGGSSMACGRTAARATVRDGRTRVASHREAPYRRPERRRLSGVRTFTLTERSRIGHRKRDAAACLADAHPEGMSGVRLGRALNMRHGMVHGAQDQKVVEHPGRAGLGGCKS